MTDLHPLRSLAAWSALATADRRDLLAQLCAVLPEGFRPGRVAVARHGIGELVHAPTGASFLLIPGGWLRMGLSVDDVWHALRARSDGTSLGVWKRSWAEELRRATPAHVVAIRAFLAAAEADGEVLDAIAGARLPAEAELEWIAREGQTTRWMGIAPGVVVTAKTRGELLFDLENGFGVERLVHEENACADSWHQGYAGAPADGRAWGDGRTVKRMGHASWQDDDEELIALHAAWRFQGAKRVGLRRAIVDLPGAPPPEPPGIPEADHDDTLAALRGTDARARRRAINALRGFRRREPSGLPALLAALRAALPELGDRRAWVEAWIAQKERSPLAREEARGPAGDAEREARERAASKRR